MSKYIIENLRFDSENLSEEMKIVKIKGAFSCDENRAAEILSDVIAGNNIVVDTNIYRNLVSFGMNCCFSSEEEVKRKQELKVKAKEEHLQYLEKIKRADAWFETLTDEQKEFVQILGYTKFRVSAVA